MQRIINITFYLFVVVSAPSSCNQPNGGLELIHHGVFERRVWCNRGGSLLAPPLDCFAALVPPPRLAAFWSRRCDALTIALTLHAQLDGGSEGGQAALHASNIGRIKVAYNGACEAWYAAGCEVEVQVELARAGW